MADVLWYVARKFKATIHGRSRDLPVRIMVALGTEHAGLFSTMTNCGTFEQDRHRDRREGLAHAARAPNDDKQIDSHIADMKKNPARATAARSPPSQFLQRFVDDTPWAHLDIAGTAMGAPKTDINHSWGSGYGVRLLDRLVRILRSQQCRPQENLYDGSPVLSFANMSARKRFAVVTWKKSLQRRWRRSRAIHLAGAHRGARCAFVDYSDDSFLPHATGALATHRISPSSSRSRRASEPGQCPLPDRQCGLPADCEATSVWFGCSTATMPTLSQPRARTDRLQGEGIRGHYWQADSTAAGSEAISDIRLNDNLRFGKAACGGPRHAAK